MSRPSSLVDLNSVGLSRAASWRADVSATAVLPAVLFSGVLGPFFGLRPANRAARLDPIVAPQVRARIYNQMDEARTSFLIPAWDKTTFAEDYKNAEGVAREFIKVADRACRIAQFLQQAPIAGPTVGWYTLWAKHFHMIRAVRVAFVGNSSFLLDLLDRPLFELFLQVSTIGNPRWRGGDPESTDFNDIAPDESAEDLRDRLAGYCAWCLERDLSSLEGRLEPETLSSVFDYQWQRNFARSLGTEQERYEREFGGIEIVGNAEAKLDRKQFEQRLGQQRYEIDRLIADLDLSEWTHRIREQKGKRPSIHFPELFGAFQQQKATSMKTTVGMMGMPWAYWGYSEQSALLHQSSLLQFVHFSDGGVIEPRNSVRNAFEKHALGTTRRIKLGLALMENVWKRAFPGSPSRSESTSAGP